MAQLCRDLCSLCRPRQGNNRPKNPGCRSFTPSKESLCNLLPHKVVLDGQDKPPEWGCFRDKSCWELLAVTTRTTHPMSPSKTPGHLFPQLENWGRSWFPMEIWNREIGNSLAKHKGDHRRPIDSRIPTVAYPPNRINPYSANCPSNTNCCNTARSHPLAPSTTFMEALKTTEKAS